MKGNTKFSWALPGRIWLLQAVYGSFFVVVGMLLLGFENYKLLHLGLYFVRWLLLIFLFLILTFLVFVAWAQWYKYSAVFGTKKNVFIAMLRSHFQLLLAIGVWGSYGVLFSGELRIAEGFGWVHLCYSVGLELACRFHMLRRFEVGD